MKRDVELLWLKCPFSLLRAIVKPKESKTVFYLLRVSLLRVLDIKFLLVAISACQLS